MTCDMTINTIFFIYINWIKFNVHNKNCWKTNKFVINVIDDIFV